MESSEEGWRPAMSSDLDSDLNQDGIIDEMDRVRENLGGDIEELGERVKKMFDWQAYIRSAPLTSVAAAVVVGYLLAPAIRTRSVRVKLSDAIDPSAFQESRSNSATQTPGLGSSLWALAMAAATRAGSAYVADLITRGMGLNAATSDTPSAPNDQPASF